MSSALKAKEKRAIEEEMNRRHNEDIIKMMIAIKEAIDDALPPEQSEAVQLKIREKLGRLDKVSNRRSAGIRPLPAPIVKS